MKQFTPLGQALGWGAAFLLTLGACSPKATTVATTSTAPPPTAEATSASSAASSFQIPVEYYTLPNGLKVVLSPDHTAPTATVAAYYNIGFRNEPRDRTGFAHLFEHLMFQGSQNLGKMEFIQLIQKNGGVLNGSTRFDFTNYFEVVPSHKLETIIWAEADRMRGLAINQANLTNQQGVVKNEVRVNVLNQPYGGFPWLDMPQYANKNWNNAHNFYGDLKDLDAATLEDAQSFFKTYYAPNNAAIAVVGDFEPAEAKAWVQKYFGNIPAVTQPPKPDLTEPRQEKEQRFTKDDKLATKPALAFAYHMPERNTPEYYALILLDQILLQGKDSRLYQAMVQKRGLTDDVGGGINYLGNAFNYAGPMLWMGNLTYDQTVKSDSVVSVLDQEINRLAKGGIDQPTLDLAMVKLRSSLYDQLSGSDNFGRADMLAAFALFDNDPSRINTLEGEFRKITPAIMQRTIQEYLRPTNRTIVVVNPLAKS
ncbi:insulinase family protein [Hymenobacter taeanensis]|uniref:Insulinase family protein n=1 Tax=Hymenobacter taeanensis TaxID=2735321 RepID=A0A6M6BHN7_9BACT|nr:MULTISPECIES: pitrilysin family protein [Hymenobacter]QJX46555.1 insulinase family protein [Hymenobacter taeanensis]UOQ80414.1 insulinase family protein [Hymenobacter sp. 5414T-23]